MIFEITPEIKKNMLQTQAIIRNTIADNRKRRFLISDDDVPKPTIPDILKDFELAKENPNIKFVYYNRFYKII